MNTNKLLKKIGFLLLAFPVLIFIIKYFTNTKAPLPYIIVSILVYMIIWAVFMVYIQQFFKQKHHIVLKIRFQAIKHIWAEPMWVLLKGKNNGPNNIKIDITHSDTMDLPSVGNMITLVAKNFDVVHAAASTNDLLKESGINPEDN